PGPAQGRQLFAVRPVADPPGAAREKERLLARLQVPDRHARVPPRTDSCQLVTPRAKRDVLRMPVRAVQGPKQGAGARVPDPHGAALVAGGQEAAVRRVGHALDRVLVAAEGELLPVTQPVQVMPLEAAQVRFAGLPGCQAVQQTQDPGNLTVLPGLVPQSDL